MPIHVSAKTEYACVAAIHLAEKYSLSEPVRVRDIAGTHGIPSSFLVQILLQLKSAGLVVSTRGASGGYQLAKSPEETSLGEIVEAIEGISQMGESSFPQDTAAIKVLKGFWRSLLAQLSSLLHETTLADLAAKLKATSEPMYYI